MGWRQAYLVLALGDGGCRRSSIYLTARRPARRADHWRADGEAGSLLTPRLALLGAAAFFCCACMGMPLFHLAGFVTMICGSSQLGATSLLVAMSSGAIGRIAFGRLADRIGSYTDLSHRRHLAGGLPRVLSRGDRHPVADAPVRSLRLCLLRQHDLHAAVHPAGGPAVPPRCRNGWHSLRRLGRHGRGRLSGRRALRRDAAALRPPSRSPRPAGLAAFAASHRPRILRPLRAVCRPAPPSLTN